MADQEFEYGKQQSLSENIFERTGYTFSGRLDVINNKVYTDQESVQDITTT
jgi:hypothetical protein